MTNPPLDRRSFLRWSGLAPATALAPRAGAGEAGNRPRIKVGQIGVGHGHATKLDVYRRSDDYEVVGVVEPDPILRARFADHEAFRGLPWMTREELLATPGLRAVLVETRVRDLLDAAEECVNRGLHVHLDKPAGASLPQYSRILEAAARQGLWVQMGYMFRYNPAVALLREVMAKGWLGEVFEVHAVMSKVVAPADRARLADFRGGMMFELGCHVIDLIVGLLGAPERVTPYPRRSSPADDGLFDNMLAVLEYPRATATVRATALEVEGFARRHLTVCGTEGTFHIQPLDSPAVRVAFAGPRGPYRQGYQDLAMPRYTRYVDDAADMARVIRGEKAPDFAVGHDFAVQAAVLRASDMPLD
ncbi:Gfo/Idh/MocA family oxidoreductase [Paludisphaera sp.]|uniref:Gfo/Idh/MocA family protein n=1 Tax=Paludisphaera sp. TaxID=2017432 RepID=UPI00301DE6C1